ncbi:hypothetical protein EOA51_33805 [Mesorhizobium sp. M1A.F.Ca.IN.020.32.1.1]|nr:hypothetical protein EOA51_33805 [Mesorhizobium sp. M1A.F.Ca.IN.020.32.1.1]
MLETLGKEDETLLQGGRKPRHSCSQAPQGRDAMRGIVESFGKEDETLLQGGLKPSHPRSEAP